MIITHFYAVESSMPTISTGLTGKNQVKIDNIWIDRKSANAYVREMKKNVFNNVKYKVVSLPVSISNDMVAFVDRFIRFSFKHPSINMYGEGVNQYYLFDVMSKFINGKLIPYKPTGSEQLDIDFKFFSNKVAKRGTPLSEFHDICQGKKESH